MSADARKQLKECHEKEPLGLPKMHLIAGYLAVHAQGVSHKGVTEISTNVEHQPIPSVAGISIVHQNNKQENAEFKGLPASSRYEEINKKEGNYPILYWSSEIENE